MSVDLVVSRPARARSGAPWRIAVVSVLVLAAPSIGTAQHAATVVVKGIDYAFQAPDTIRAGGVTFSLENRGKVRHEILLLRLKDGHTFGDYMQAKTQEERRALTRALGLIFSDAGEDSAARLAIEVLSGQQYVLICAIRDGPDKPAHVALGMAKAIYVK